LIVAILECWQRQHRKLLDKEVIACCWKKTTERAHGY